MLSLYTVCFFGHRQVDDFQSAEQAVESLIENLIQEHEFVEFLVGRDGEFDQIVSSTILRLKKRTDKANCSLTWVMPYLKADYINNQESYASYYDSVEVCEQSAHAHPKAAIQIRNRSIIARADLCVFYVSKKKGGAYQTFRYAETTGIPIINLITVS